MPIYEYKCAKCGKIIEIIHHSASVRKYCAGDCEMEGKPGDGDLTRIISKPAETRSNLNITGKIDYDDAAKKGFTTFRKAGKGKYERIAGNAGPERIVSED